MLRPRRRAVAPLHDKSTSFHQALIVGPPSPLGKRSISDFGFQFSAIIPLLTATRILNQYQHLQPRRTLITSLTDNARMAWPRLVFGLDCPSCSSFWRSLKMAVLITIYAIGPT
ncbi:hypothetical protein H9L39_08870 [Fusarium oxysporum f. sp. albedinis]|nr:hypothetical protein H9L39_08870 [Fusarium oxysporum f. sp. albedinis]